MNICEKCGHDKGGSLAPCWECISKIPPSPAELAERLVKKVVWKDEGGGCGSVTVGTENDFEDKGWMKRSEARKLAKSLNLPYESF